MWYQVCPSLVTGASLSVPDTPVCWVPMDGAVMLGPERTLRMEVVW